MAVETQAGAGYLRPISVTGLLVFDDLEVLRKHT